LYDISSAVQKYVENNHFSIVRDFVGHGIGRFLHEEPEIPNFGEPHTGPVLKAGMVFAIEPMVNLGNWQTKILQDGWTVVTMDKKPSAHFEHTIVVTQKDPEILTH
jgi:methionyl aminopeptidase